MARQPIYQLIAEDLRKQIDSGELPRGSQLPREIELMDQYSSSRNTVRDALKRLASQGLVETRPGHGTFVTTKIDPFVTVLTSDPKTGTGRGEGTSYLSRVSHEHRSPKVTSPKVEVQIPPLEIARRLRIGPDVQVVSRHRQRYIDGIPWSLQTSFYPMGYVTEGAVKLLVAQPLEQGSVHYLAESIGRRQAGYRDWITARLPNDDEQLFFGVPYDQAVFEIFRTAYDEEPRPMRVTVTVFPADRNQFVVNVGEVPGPR